MTSSQSCSTSSAAGPSSFAEVEALGRMHVLASLNHPNIGDNYELEEAEGQTAPVLELVEGPP